MLTGKVATRRILRKERNSNKRTPSKVLKFPGSRTGPELDCPEEGLEFRIDDHCHLTVGDRVTVEIPIEVRSVSHHSEYSFIVGCAENGAMVAFDSNAPKGVFAEWPAA